MSRLVKASFWKLWKSRDELDFHQHLFKKKVVKYDPVTLCCWPRVSERNILRVERRGVRHYAANLLYPKALLEKIMPETPEAMRNNEDHVKETGKKKLVSRTAFHTLFLNCHDAVNCFLTPWQLLSLAARRRKLRKLIQLWSWGFSW